MIFFFLFFSNEFDAFMKKWFHWMSLEWCVCVCECVRFVLYIKIQASIALLDDDDYTQMHRTSFTRRNDASYPFFAKIKKRRKKKLVSFTCRCFYMLWLEWNSVCYVVENVWLCCEWRAYRLKTKVIRRLHSFQMWIWVSKMPKINFGFCIFDGCVFLSLNFRLKKKDGTRLVIPAKSNVRQKEQSKNSSCIAQSRRHFDDAEAKKQCIFSFCIHLLFILHFDS